MDMNKAEFSAESNILVLYEKTLKLTNLPGLAIIQRLLMFNYSIYE